MGSDRGTRRRSRAQAVIVLAVGLALTASVVVAVRSMDDGVPATPEIEATIPSPESAQDQAARSGGSVCGLGTVQPSGGLSKAPPTTWTRVADMAVPSVEGAGPGRVDADGFRWCFANTPTGAVLMAASFMTVGTLDELFDKVSRTSILPGAERDMWMANRPSEAPRDVDLTILGFTVHEYSSFSVGVDLALQISARSTGEGAVVSFPLKLRWSDGDWRVQLTEAGTPANPVYLESLDGFVRWSAVTKPA